MCLFFMTIMKRVVICKTTLRSLKQGFVFEPMNEKKKLVGMRNPTIGGRPNSLAKRVNTLHLHYCQIKFQKKK